MPIPQRQVAAGYERLQFRRQVFALAAELLRGFFRGAAERALVQATDVLANLIETELENILNKK